MQSHLIRIVPAIIQSGHYSHPWLGFSGDTLNPLGPLDKIGLNRGDIITAPDRIPVRTIGDLLTYLGEHKSVGDIIKLPVNRNVQMMDLDAIIQARPSASTGR